MISRRTNLISEKLSSPISPSTMFTTRSRYALADGMVKLLARAALMASIFTAASPVLADEVDLFLQSRLKELGHYNGTIDGQPGPKTLAAIKSYASEQGIQPTRADVISRISQQAREARTPPTPAELEAAEAAVKDILKDPEAARFSKPFSYETAQDGTAICGKVNAKNAYGGYVGEQWYWVIVQSFQGKASALPPWLESDGADLMCILGSGMPRIGD